MIHCCVFAFFLIFYKNYFFNFLGIRIRIVAIEGKHADHCADTPPHHGSFLRKCLKMGQPRPLFAYFCSFQTQILQKKTVGVSGIQTRIVRVEGKHADYCAGHPRLFSSQMFVSGWSFVDLDRPTEHRVCVHSFSIVPDGIIIVIIINDFGKNEFGFSQDSRNGRKK